MAYQSFEELVVWKKSFRLAVTVYREFKPCRDYGLKDQITRAAVSIPSNIAEGSERESTREFIRFLNFSKGSAAELRTQIYIAKEICLISPATANSINQELKQISSMLHGLVKSLKSQLI
ncbi:MAG: four helix bundle protein [Gammaproteobacteria bacterium]|nr:four helix bundle protein [Gammaproteobacteria bacterium]